MEFYQFIYKYLGNKRKYLFYLFILSLFSNLLIILIPVFQKTLLAGVMLKNINIQILIIFGITTIISVLISFLIEMLTKIAVAKLKESYNKN